MTSHARGQRAGRRCHGRFVIAADAYATGFFREMTSWSPSWQYDVISKIRLRHSMPVYLKSNGAKFNLDSIWNDGA